MKLQLIAVRTKMPDWVHTGFTDYLKCFPKELPFELTEIAAGKRGKNTDIARILEKEGTGVTSVSLSESPWADSPARQPPSKAGSLSC